MTSKFGSDYTVATAAAASATANAAPSLNIAKPLVFGFATVLLSTMVGAVITL